jgi:hypothetical protein
MKILQSSTGLVAPSIAMIELNARNREDLQLIAFGMRSSATTYKCPIPQTYICIICKKIPAARSDYISKQVGKFHDETKERLSLVFGNLPFPITLALTSQRIFLRICSSVLA